MKKKSFDFILFFLIFTSSVQAAEMPGSDPSSYTPIEFLDPELVEAAEKPEPSN